MPVEIIPKKRTVVSKPGISPFNILYYLALILLFIAFLSYFWINISYKKSKQELAGIEAAIAEKETKKVKSLEERVLLAKEKIETFTALFRRHKKTTNLFDFLKQNCHKKAFFSRTEIDAEQSIVKLTGKVESLRALAEQILIFREQDLVNNLTLLEVNIGKKGGIDFEIKLSLNSQIFR